MPGGAPQGTKSGNFLFCVATRDLDERERQQMTRAPPTPMMSLESPLALAPAPSPTPTCMSLGLSDLALRISTPMTSPIGGYVDMRGKGKSVCYLDDTSEESQVLLTWDNHEHPLRWQEWPTKTTKFVDDITGRCRNDTTAALSHFTTNREQKKIWAEGAQDFYDCVSDNAVARGMVVNPRKTKMVCITAPVGAEVSSFIRAGGTTIESQDTLSIVGYTFGKKPGPQAHLDSIKRKVSARSWIVRNLKKPQIPTGKLVQVYCAMIRPLLEYAAPVFHPLLTQEQSEALEKQQRSVMKTIFGFSTPYRECLRIAGIQELHVRRAALFEAFTRKAYESQIWNPRWFTAKPPSTYALRKENVMVQHMATTNRLKNAPLYRMRELVNDLTKKGQLH